MEHRRRIPVSNKICQFGGKVSYKTERLAKLARATMDKWGKGVKDMRIYRCPNCYNYHFTSRKD